VNEERVDIYCCDPYTGERATPDAGFPQPVNVVRRRRSPTVVHREAIPDTTQELTEQGEGEADAEPSANKM
jgi:hypothetical protein